MPARLTFLSHFIIVLACAALAFFAWRAGAIMMVWQSDASMMTSVIAVLFVGTAVWLGWQAWELENNGWGDRAESLAVKFGLIGTGVGIILTIAATLASASPLSALQTAFFSMISGVAASSVISIMTFNLERGIARSHK